MKHSMKSRLAVTTATLALVAAGGVASLAPASAAPTVDVQRTSAVTPTLGMGAGAYAWWCGFYGIGCKYKTFYDRTLGYYKVKCANIGCTRFIW